MNDQLKQALSEWSDGDLSCGGDCPVCRAFAAGYRGERRSYWTEKADATRLRDAHAAGRIAGERDALRARVAAGERAVEATMRCAECNGRGGSGGVTPEEGAVGEPCEECGGSGRVPVEGLVFAAGGFCESCGAMPPLHRGGCAALPPSAAPGGSGSDAAILERAARHVWGEDFTPHPDATAWRERWALADEVRRIARALPPSAAPAAPAAPECRCGHANAAHSAPLGCAHCFCWDTRPNLASTPAAPTGDWHCPDCGIDSGELIGTGHTHNCPQRKHP